MKQWLIIDVCPRLLNRFHKNKLDNENCFMQQSEVNKVSNKIGIFCHSENHNCFLKKSKEKNRFVFMLRKGE